ncbi:hypothetical protein [Pseudoalteromonas sp. R3]|nr:hypothetical protein [Pseudoalteromonas sp. R3]
MKQLFTAVTMMQIELSFAFRVYAVALPGKTSWYNKPVIYMASNIFTVA